MEKRFEVEGQVPGLWMAKTIDSTISFCSNDFSKMLGWKSVEASIGKTDYEIPCRVSEFADIFIKFDKKVMDTRKPILTMDTMPCAVGWRIFLAEKKVTTDEYGDVIGTIGTCIDVTDVAIFKKCLLLNNFDQKITNTVNKPTSYVLNSEHSPLPLTKQQEVCLFLLVRGKSPKKIADILCISVRTVEAHIEAMRRKLGCCSKSEVIEKAIDNGYFYYIPQEMLNYAGDL